MRRSLQRLRAVVTPRISEAILGPNAAQRGVLAFLALVGAFLVVPVLVVGLGVLLTRSMTIAHALAGVASSAVVLVGGLWLLRNWFVGHVRKARERARELVQATEVTSPSRCRGCGGEARVVAVAHDGVFPCPWCEALQLPGPTLEQASQAVLAQLLAMHRDLAVRASATARGGSSQTRSTPTSSAPAGFELIGGVLIEGQCDGVALAGFNELVGERCIQRIEVEAQTGVEGEVWAVRPEVEAHLRALAAEWSYELPRQQIGSPVAGWCVYGTTRAPVDVLTVALERLGPAESLLFDPAGLSVWRSVSLLAAGWSLVAERQELVAWLARALELRRQGGDS